MHQIQNQTNNSTTGPNANINNKLKQQITPNNINSENNAMAIESKNNI
jgi:hypothetical protein